jgi:hypothetical protein
MTDIIFSMNDAQFQRILTVQQGWWPIASVFVSAFLAMMVGIGVERLRAWVERKKINHERQEQQINQINAVISGLTFNIELLTHIVSQNILPHYRDSRSICEEINKGGMNDDHHIVAFLSKHPCFFMTCPEMYLVEYDFSKELPFIIEHDPEMVKHSGWLVNGIREIKAITARRNQYVEDALALDRLNEGPGNIEKFKTVAKRQESIATTECIVSSQLIEVLVRLEKNLEKINESFKIPKKKSKITLPEPLKEMMRELKEISDAMPIRN